eukprot:IDg12372t1
MCQQYKILSKTTSRTNVPACRVASSCIVPSETWSSFSKEYAYIPMKQCSLEMKAERTRSLSRVAHPGLVGLETDIRNFYTMIA